MDNTCRDCVFYDSCPFEDDMCEHYSEIDDYTYTEDIIEDNRKDFVSDWFNYIDYCER